MTAPEIQIRAFQPSPPPAPVAGMRQKMQPRRRLKVRCKQIPSDLLKLIWYNDESLSVSPSLFQPYGQQRILRRTPQRKPGPPLVPTGVAAHQKEKTANVDVNMSRKNRDHPGHPFAKKRVEWEGWNRKPEEVNDGVVGSLLQSVNAHSFR
ncbi:hypothetical protein CDAR_266411 [Caerostris darwini]|uniref:Uncharacterized protein n=1 Tax=Caerostris darwini TaxID=1538125 RepID=A0AAV4Q5C7_9ARAC|nr:hypothetical protein CDAR_266411 [Caerostris darwini]